MEPVEVKDYFFCFRPKNLVEKITTTGEIHQTDKTALLLM
jgi:hypothetical protein